MSDLLCDIQPIGDNRQPHMYSRDVIMFDPVKGVLEFDGRIIHEIPPIQCILTVHQMEKEPYKTDDYTLYYRMARYEKYTIEITRKEVLEDTSIIGEEDGIHVCFTPSERQRIWFTILDQALNLL